MRYVRGKGSRERRVHARPESPMSEQQTASGLFRTIPDGEFCSRNLLSLAFGRAALHLSNQRPRELASLSVQQRERESERKRERERERGKEGKRERQPSCCNFVSLTFAFGACSIDIGNCAAAANTPPETRSSYYLNILRDTRGEFSTPFIVSAFPTKGDRSEESLGRVFERRSRRKPYREGGSSLSEFLFFYSKRKR